MRAVRSWALLQKMVVVMLSLTMTRARTHSDPRSLPSISLPDERPLVENR